MSSSPESPPTGGWKRPLGTTILLLLGVGSGTWRLYTHPQSRNYILDKVSIFRAFVHKTSRSEHVDKVVKYAFSHQTLTISALTILCLAASKYSSDLRVAWNRFLRGIDTNPQDALVDYPAEDVPEGVVGATEETDTLETHKFEKSPDRFPMQNAIRRKSLEPGHLPVKNVYSASADNITLLRQEGSDGAEWADEQWTEGSSGDEFYSSDMGAEPHEGEYEQEPSIGLSISSPMKRRPGTSPRSVLHPPRGGFEKQHRAHYRHGAMNRFLRLMRGQLVGIDEEELHHLYEHMQRIQLEPGEVLFNAGTISEDGMYIVLEGKLGVFAPEEKVSDMFLLQSDEANETGETMPYKTTEHHHSSHRHSHGLYSPTPIQTNKMFINRQSHDNFLRRNRSNTQLSDQGDGCLYSDHSSSAAEDEEYYHELLLREHGALSTPLGTPPGFAPFSGSALRSKAADRARSLRRQKQMNTVNISRKPRYGLDGLPLPLVVKQSNKYPNFLHASIHEESQYLTSQFQLFEFTVAQTVGENALLAMTSLFDSQPPGSGRQPFHACATGTLALPEDPTTQPNLYKRLHVDGLRPVTVAATEHTTVLRVDVRLFEWFFNTQPGSLIGFILHTTARQWKIAAHLLIDIFRLSDAWLCSLEPPGCVPAFEFVDFPTPALNNAPESEEVAEPTPISNPNYDPLPTSQAVDHPSELAARLSTATATEDRAHPRSKQMTGSGVARRDGSSTIPECRAITADSNPMDMDVEAVSESSTALPSPQASLTGVLAGGFRISRPTFDEKDEDKKGKQKDVTNRTQVSTAVDSKRHKNGRRQGKNRVAEPRDAESDASLRMSEASDDNLSTEEEFGSGSPTTGLYHLHAQSSLSISSDVGSSPTPSTTPVPFSSQSNANPHFTSTSTSSSLRLGNNKAQLRKLNTTLNTPMHPAYPSSPSQRVAPPTVPSTNAPPSSHSANHNNHNNIPPGRDEACPSKRDPEPLPPYAPPTQIPLSVLKAAAAQVLTYPPGAVIYRAGEAGPPDRDIGHLHGSTASRQHLHAPGAGAVSVRRDANALFVILDGFAMCTMPAPAKVTGPIRYASGRRLGSLDGCSGWEKLVPPNYPLQVIPPLATAYGAYGAYRQGSGSSGAATGFSGQRQVVTRLLGPGSIAGGQACLASAPHRDTFVAVTALTVAVFPRHLFDEYALKHESSGAAGPQPTGTTATGFRGSTMKSMNPNGSPGPNTMGSSALPKDAPLPPSSSRRNSAVGTKPTTSTSWATTSSTTANVGTVAGSVPGASEPPRGGTPTSSQAGSAPKSASVSGKTPSSTTNPNTTNSTFATSTAPTDTSDPRLSPGIALGGVRTRFSVAPEAGGTPHAGTGTPSASNNAGPGSYHGRWTRMRVLSLISLSVARSYVALPRMFLGLGLQRVWLKSGESLFKEGDNANDGLYVVVSGRVRSTFSAPIPMLEPPKPRPTRNGVRHKQQIVQTRSHSQTHSQSHALSQYAHKEPFARMQDETGAAFGERVVSVHLGRGETVGELSVLARERVRSSSAIATRDCELVRISRSAFEHITSIYPTVLEHFTTLLARRHDELTRRLALGIGRSAAGTNGVEAAACIPFAPPPPPPTTFGLGVGNIPGTRFLNHSELALHMASRIGNPALYSSFAGGEFSLAPGLGMGGGRYHRSPFQRIDVQGIRYGSPFCIPPNHAAAHFVTIAVIPAGLETTATGVPVATDEMLESFAHHLAAALEKMDEGSVVVVNSDTVRQETGIAVNTGGTQNLLRARISEWLGALEERHRFVILRGDTQSAAEIHHATRAGSVGGSHGGSEGNGLGANGTASGSSGGADANESSGYHYRNPHPVHPRSTRKFAGQMVSGLVSKAQAASQRLWARGAGNGSGNVGTGANGHAHVDGGTNSQRVSAWTKLCVSQSDLILLVGHGRGCPDLSLAERTEIYLTSSSSSHALPAYATRGNTALTSAGGPGSLPNETLVESVTGLDTDSDSYIPRALHSQHHAYSSVDFPSHRNTSHTSRTQASSKTRTPPPDGAATYRTLDSSVPPIAAPSITPSQSVCLSRTYARKELVLLHPDPRQPIERTRHWLSKRRVSWHHHVRTSGARSELDFERLARHICGKAVGAVLGGGGSRGLAHMGTLRALERRGVPIDVIGGTSQGAFMAACYALTLDPISSDHVPGSMEAKVKRLSEVVGSAWTLFTSLTLPIISYTSGRHFNDVIQETLGGVQIEDLPIRYFCVSTNVTDDSIAVHLVGPLWRYVRASMTVMGLLPPLYDAPTGRLLVDGGYTSNLPVEIMRLVAPQVSLCIASDVENKNNSAFENVDDPGDVLSGWYVAFKWLLGALRMGKPFHFPSSQELTLKVCYARHTMAIRELLSSPGYDGAFEYLDDDPHAPDSSSGAFDEEKMNSGGNSDGDSNSPALSSAQMATETRLVEKGANPTNQTLASYMPGPVLYIRAERIGFYSLLDYHKRAEIQKLGEIAAENELDRWLEKANKYAHLLRQKAQKKI